MDGFLFLSLNIKVTARGQESVATQFSRLRYSLIFAAISKKQIPS